MTITEVPPVRRKIIGNRLRELREACGKSVGEVAKLMGVSRAAAYRQETGHTAVSLADAEKYFRIYGVEGTLIAEHIASLVIGDRDGRGKKTPRNIKNSGSQIEVAELEDIADRFFHYAPMLIAGPLQCDEYIDVLFSPKYVGPVGSPGEIEQGYALRKTRRNILHREHRPQMTFILTEAALKYQIGSPDVMRSQARHMISLIRNNHIDVRIIPFSSGFITGMSRTVFLVEIGKDNPVRVAYYDLMSYGQLVEDDAIISLVREQFGRLLEVALPPEKTADLLESYYE